MMAKDLTVNEEELVERAWKSIPIHNCRVVDRGGVPFDVIDNGRLITRDDFTDILTRFLGEVRRDGVDVEKVWYGLLGVCMLKQSCPKDWTHPVEILDGKWVCHECGNRVIALLELRVTKEHLAAALLAAQGEK